MVDRPLGDRRRSALPRAWCWALALAFAAARPALAQEAPPARDRDAPDVASLATAPSADKASGHLREHERDEGAVRTIVRAVLWTPRELLELGLWVPEEVAGRLDDYYESRGPDVYDRGGAGGWSGGAMLLWEAPFGPSVGARIGHVFGRRARADATAVVFGRYGYTGRVSASVAASARVQIELAGEIGHDHEVVLAGIGDHPLGDAAAGADLDPFGSGALPETILDDRVLAFRVAAPIQLAELPGRFRLRPSLRVERHDLAPDEPAAFAYDRSRLLGLGQPFRFGLALVDVGWDARVAPAPWIPRAAPATGWRARAAVGYAIGDVDGGDDFRFARWAVSAERLFDLFRGTRVLTLSAHIQGITGDRARVPFLLLPALGGPDDLRAFSRGRFRDEVATSAELAYEWAIGLRLRVSLFTEVGGVHEGVGALDAEHLHLSAGAALRQVYDDGNAARFVVAGSDTGEASFFVVLGGV